MSVHPPCVVCGKDIKREKGEREPIWLSRHCCSLACRDVQRGRTQAAKAGERLAWAVKSWVPGTAVSTHAQLNSVKHERLREALKAAGHTLEPARRGRPMGSPNKPKKLRRRNEPPEDRLLPALIKAYGPSPPAYRSSRRLAA